MLAGLWCIYAILTGCTIPLSLEPPRDVAVSSTQSEYSFNPQSILRSISEGQQDVFHLEWEENLLRYIGPTPVAKIVRPTLTPSYPPVAWREIDFLTVAQAFVRFSEKDDTTNGRLYEIRYQASCQDAVIGPQLLMFGFFKIINSDTQKRYVRTHIQLNILTGRLTWINAELSEVQNEEQALDRSSTSYITVERSLQIAESAGGAEFRRRYDNQCGVLGWLKAGIANEQWRVAYDSAATTFEIQIDKMTGRAKVVKTPAP